MDVLDYERALREVTIGSILRIERNTDQGVHEFDAVVTSREVFTRNENTRMELKLGQPSTILEVKTLIIWKGLLTDLHHAKGISLCKVYLIKP